jgi:hypothetical protein
LLVLAFILAGCGGGGNTNWQQIQGHNFRFQAPAGWTIAGAAASNGKIDRVEVVEFKLLRPYKHTRLAAATRELDSVAVRLAQQLKGKVTRRRTVRVGGYDARSYGITYKGLTEEITFVLHGRHEYELLCRRAVSADDAGCRRLVASFHAL